MLESFSVCLCVVCVVCGCMCVVCVVWDVCLSFRLSLSRARARALSLSQACARSLALSLALCLSLSLLLSPLAQVRLLFPLPLSHTYIGSQTFSWHPKGSTTKSFLICLCNGSVLSIGDPSHSVHTDCTNCACRSQLQQT